jgi:molecular chaperone GrpE
LSKKSKNKTEAPPAPVDEVPEAPEAADAAHEGGAEPTEDAEAARGQAESTEQRLVELEEELSRVHDEARDANDRALRILAEFDTYRRRTQKERADASERGAADVLRELLDVADNFDRALEHIGDDVPEAFVDGMRLVARSLHEVLDRRGVERIEAVGREFDPEHHEALSSLPDAEAEPNTVLSEVQPGYMLGDKVLRPSKVIVSRAKAE